MPAAEGRLLQMSTLREEGVMAVKQTACDQLLASRVEQKLQARHPPSICQVSRINAGRATVETCSASFQRLPSAAIAVILKQSAVGQHCRQCISLAWNASTCR